MAEEIISCIEAKRQGLSYYFSGKACIQGHIGKRIVSSRGCSVCRIQIKRNWAKKNPTKVREQKNKTYLKYRDKYLQQYKERDLKHPLKKRAARATRKALKRGNGGIHTANDVSRIYRAQRGKCAYCRRKVGEEYHIDHIFPLSKGGTNDRRNIQITCGPCNLHKSAKDPIDYARSQGMLL